MDPTTSEWTELPDPPVAHPTDRWMSWMVWTGAELLFGGEADAAAYDPIAGTWRVLPAPPVPIHMYSPYSELWIGTEALFLEDDEVVRPSGRLVLLDPVAGAWRVTEPAPLGARQWAPYVWTGHEVLWWSGEPTMGDVSPGECCWPDAEGVSFTP